MKQEVRESFMGICLLVMVYLVSREAGMMAAVSSAGIKQETKQLVVAIDPGHGGRDPGKVGIHGSLEKDINLQIAMKLKTYLEASDVSVIMTREADVGLYEENDKQKKMADMKNRCDLINEAKPDLTVSIHQNSYHQEEVQGGQVFYYKTSEKGKALAEVLQERLNMAAGGKNGRKAKSNESYYLLLHVQSPIVIAECGFLSNRQESARLSEPEYQDRIAWALHMGIMEQLHEKRKGQGEM